MRKYIAPVILLVFAVFCGFLIHFSTSFVSDIHFPLLAEAFTKNNLYLDPVHLPHGDFADYRGKQFIFYGPLPAIILVPFVYIFGVSVDQYYFSFLSIILVYFGVFNLCRRLNFSKLDCFWLANFFVFGTVFYYLALLNISAYLVQALGTVFIIFSLYEYFSKKRWLLIGFLIALAGLTRVNLFAMTLFFALEIFRVKRFDGLKILITLMIPVLISVAVLGIYNYRRFGNPLESGYTKHATEVHDPRNNNHLGYFNIVHAPAKLYLLLFAGPEYVNRSDVELVLRFPYLKANGFGLAIWFTSPLFIYLIVTKRRPYSISAWATIPFLMLPALMFSGPGSTQYGYRYALDFLPLLFLLLLPAFGSKLKLLPKIIITYGVLFNLFYMVSMWNSYPVFCFFKLMPC